MRQLARSLLGQGAKSVHLFLSFSLPSSTARSYQGTSKSHSQDGKATEWEEYGSLNDCTEQSSLLTASDGGMVGKSTFIVQDHGDLGELFIMAVSTYKLTYPCFLLFLKKEKIGFLTFL